MSAKQLDIKKLERIGCVKIDPIHINELVELLKIYEHRFKDPPLSRTLMKMQRDWIGYRRPRRAELDARRAFVEAVEGVWRECGGRKRGAHFDAIKDVYSGPLVTLIQELFRGFGSTNPPSAATLHHDLKFLATGRERRR